LSDAERTALRVYGLQLGLAFQIADDVLDYMGTEGELGKPIGHDVEEGFATLPLMLAMQDDSVAKELGVMLDIDQKLSAQEAKRVVEAVSRSSGPVEALKLAREHATAAREQLKFLTPGDAVTALQGLADYVVSRKL
jgi:octaprenyl-diphosphate synthase